MPDHFRTLYIKGLNTAYFWLPVSLKLVNLFLFASHFLWQFLLTVFLYACSYLFLFPFTTLSVSFAFSILKAHSSGSSWTTNSSLSKTFKSFANFHWPLQTKQWSTCVLMDYMSLGDFLYFRHCILNCLCNNSCITPGSFPLPFSWLQNQNFNAGLHNLLHYLQHTT